MIGLTGETAEKVDALMYGAASIDGAVRAVAAYLGVPPHQVAEYVTVARTGRFDVVTEEGDADDQYEGNPQGVAVREHGELGPVLMDPAHNFKSLSEIS